MASCFDKLSMRIILTLSLSKGLRTFGAAAAQRREQQRSSDASRGRTRDVLSRNRS
jgi:hypothetical protein